MFGLSKKKRPSQGKGKQREARIFDKTATVVLNDISYPVLYWTPEEFRVGGYKGGLKSGTTARARLVLLHRGSPTGFDTTVRIVHENPTAGELTGQFSDMSDRVRENLQKVYKMRLAEA